jgi:hypothetical protein
MGRFALVSRTTSKELSYNLKSTLFSQSVLLSTLRTSSVILFLSLSILTFAFFIPFSFAATSIVPVGECQESNIMAYMHRPINTHGATYQSEGYDYVLCYAPMHNSATEKTLSYTDPVSKNVCWGGNEIFGLTSSRNAHFGVPRRSDPLYDDVCYGYLSCYAANTAGTNEQRIGKLQAGSNTHFSDQSAVDDVFPINVVCHEPVCDRVMYDRQIPYPNLYSFDDEVWVYELFGTTNYDDIYDKRGVSVPLNGYALFTGAEMSIAPRITNWTGYNGLQFFIFIPQDFSQAGAYDFKFEIKPKNGGSVWYNLADYTESPIRSNTWIRVRIPFQNFKAVGPSFNVYDEIERIRFLAPASGMFVDSMSFVSAVVSGGNMWQNFYCGRSEVTAGNYNYVWANNLDDGSVLSQNACDNIQGYTATGSQCCGDDMFEFYPDSNKGCFYSRPISNNTVFNFPEHKVVCVGEECSYLKVCVGDCPEQRDLGEFIAQLQNQNKSSTIPSSVFGQPTGTKVSQTLNLANVSRYTGFYAQVEYLDNFSYGYKDGTFYACAPSGQASNFELSNYLGQAVSGSSLFTTMNECDSVGDFVCTTNGFTNRVDNVMPMILNASNPNAWYTIQSASERNTRKIDLGTGQSACCPQSSCSLNGICYPNMLNIQNAQPVIVNSQERLCHNGEWTGAAYKIALDGFSSGYCALQSQCLVNPSGVPDSLTNPKCVNSGQSFQHAYCDAGNWTSSTSLVAQAMVDFAQNKGLTQYTLFCDDLDVSLNYLGVLATSGSGNNMQTEELLRGLSQIDSSQNFNKCNGVDCVNNFCVLNAKLDGELNDNQIIIGTSTNIPVSNTSIGLGAVFNLTSCNPQSTSLTKCGNTKWYHDGAKRITIYNGPEGSFSLGTSFNRIVNWISGVFGNSIQPSLTGAFAKSKLFERLYVAKTTNKAQGFGFAENFFDYDAQSEVRLLYVEYTFSGNAQQIATSQARVCQIVADLSDQLKLQTGQNNQLKCVEKTSGVIISAVGIDEEFIWTRLTSQLRFE